MRMIRALAVSASILLSATFLSACAPTLSLPPAPDANNPMCAEVSVRLPDAIGEHSRRWTDAQATGSWGDQAVIVSCGFAPPAPTAEFACFELDGIDWLVDPEYAPNLRLLTYGRDPAVQVWINTETTSSNEALTALAPAVSQIPASGRCISPSDLPG